MDREHEFRAFVADVSPALFRLASGLTVPGQTSDDLVQATLLDLWRSWPRARDAENPKAYARRALVNAAASAGRRRWHLERPAADPPDAAGPDPTDAVALRDELLRAVRTLPAKQRAAVVMRYLEDLPDSEIALALECSVQTVRSQISRALASLRVRQAEEVTSC